MYISLFFLTGLVTQGDYYTFYSLICLSAVTFGCLIPTPFIESLSYYGIYLLLEITGFYFLINSIIFRVKTTQV
jgi:hypothetical protein